MSYVVRVQLVNEDERVQFSDFEDPYLGDETPGEIFRACRSEYGRCESKIFQDYKDGSIKHVGWYFRSRQRYEDTGEPYLRGAWVTLYREVEPERPAVLESVDLGGRP